MITRRTFLKAGAVAGVAYVMAWPGGLARRAGVAPTVLAQIPGGTLDPAQRAEVPDAHVDPAGDAHGRHDSQAGRPERRLLRDLGEAVPTADIAGRPPRHDGMGLWRGRKRQQPRSAAAQRAVAHHRSPTQQTRTGQVDQRLDGPGHRQRPSSSVARGPDPALGQSARRRHGPRYTADLHHLRPARTPDRSRSSRMSTARSASATKATAMRRRGICLPPTIFLTTMPPWARGTISSLTRRPPTSARRGDRAMPRSNIPMPIAPRRSGITTTRWA